MGKNEQGVTMDRFMMIPRTLVFLTRGDHVLLLKGAANKRLWANHYNGVGGHVERGEDVLTSARREVMEETGLIPDDLWLVGTIAIDARAEVGIMVFVFRGICSQGTLAPSPEGDLEWVRFADLDQLKLVEDLPRLLERVLITERGGDLFFADYSYDSDDRLVIRFAQGG